MAEIGDKRGLSAVVSNLLLILLVLVTIAIVWAVISAILSRGGGDIQTGVSQLSFNLQIQSAYVSGTDVLVNVKRNAGGGQITGIRFIFSNDTDSVIVDRIGVLNELERKTFTFTSSEIPGIGRGDEVSVSPIYDSGGQKVGGVTDTAIISGNPPSGAGGTGNPGTGICGDALIQNPDSNGINEQCDGNNLGGQTCTGLGFVGGTLSCDSGCQFDTMQCTGAAPPTCNGIWEGVAEDTGIECDGTPLPNGCAADCRCEQGFSPDGSGLCNLNPPLNTGTINSVWNNIFFDSHDLPKDDTVTNYINSYANFSNSAETGCFLITFAHYLQNNNISYLRLDDSISLPNINPNEGYSIWEAQNCGQ
ncbi:MAG: hypothetical protein AABX79_01075 [Nanoarchaeota archaeon]